MSDNYLLSVMVEHYSVIHLSYEVGVSEKYGDFSAILTCSSFTCFRPGLLDGLLCV